MHQVADSNQLTEQLAALLAAGLKPQDSSVATFRESNGERTDAEFIDLAKMLLGEVQVTAETAPEETQHPANFNSSSGALEWDDNILRELATTGTVAEVRPKKQELLTDVCGNTEEINETSEQRCLVYSAKAGAQWAESITAEVVALTQKRRTQDGWVWMDVTGVTEHEMELLGRAFKLHPLTVEDILADSEDSDKVERIGDYVLVIFRTATQYQTVVTTAVVVGRGSVLTFHSGVTAHLQTQQILRRVVEGATGGWYVAYVVVDEATDGLSEAMRAVDAEVRDVDALVMALPAHQNTDRLLQRIGVARRRILGLWQLLPGKPDAVRELWRCATNSDQIEHQMDDQIEELRHRLADVCDHLASLAALAAHCELVLARAHANYLAQLSLNATHMTMRVRVFSNRCLVLVALMLPLHLVTLAFGQNIVVPWNTHEKDRGSLAIAWLAIMGCILALFSSALLLARYLRIV
ncbi:CorA metal ion transporter [Coemansia sp. RSA 1365]|nr:CorA metal ion transporter [Coemansia sp. RSA 1365]